MIIICQFCVPEARANNKSELANSVLALHRRHQFKNYTLRLAIYARAQSVGRPQMGTTKAPGGLAPVRFRPARKPLGLAGLAARWWGAHMQGPTSLTGITFG